jgi:predicted dehydrogenase
MRAHSRLLMNDSGRDTGMDNTTGIGILGFAHAHVAVYCREWTEHPELGVRLAAAWDPDASRLDEAAARFGVRRCGGPEDVLECPDVAAVVIGAETTRHAELVEQSASAGKAVLLQKPLALTMEEADRIVAAVERAEIRFTLAWQMRRDPQNLTIREMIRSGSLGRLFMLRRRHGLSLLLDPRFASSWHVDPKLNRDIWADDASHAIDFVYWLLGLPETVTAEIESFHDPRMPMDNGIAVYRYPQGPLAEVCCSFTNPAGENTTEIVGDGGSLVQNHGDAVSCNAATPPGAVGLKWFLRQSGRWAPSELAVPATHGERITALAGPLAAFARGTEPAIATAEEGRDVLRMTLAAYLSAREGRRVRLDDPRIAGI